MLNKSLFLIFFVCLFCSLVVCGQNQSIQPKENEKAISFYREIVGENATLYKGKVYVGVNQNVEGHPFFGSDKWEIGTLFYNGKKYQKLPMLYDIFRDELIIQHLNGFLKIQVLKSGVALFSFPNKIFIHIQDLGSEDFPLPLGFYQKIYDGKLTVLVKRQKKIIETIEEMTVKKEFEIVNQFYIHKDGNYFLVKGKNSVLQVLKDHKKEVRKELASKKIKFRKNPEYAILKMVEYYEKAIIEK